MKLRTLGFALAISACATTSSLFGVPAGSPGFLVVLVADTTGAPRARVNAYLAEDARITSEVVKWGNAGAWTDSLGFASLGGWRPGPYKLVVRALGFKQEQRSVSVQAGRTDTVRVVLKPQLIEFE
jgi:uncharacterized membrane protein